jgi:hypothetical protein
MEFFGFLSEGFYSVFNAIFQFYLDAAVVNAVS